MAGISWAEGVSSGTNFPISSGTNFPISNGTNAISGAILGAALQHSNGTNVPISNGTNFPISSGTNAISGADLQHSLLAVTYSLVLALGLAGSAVSLLSPLSHRAKPLSHSYILLLHLALLDALFLCVLPLHIHSQLRGDTWAFGDTACRATAALFGLHAWLSVALLGCLAGDLWLAALHPLASIQLRATHYQLLATSLWLVALGGTVPLAPRGAGPGGCFGSFPGSWAEPTAPAALLALVFGVAVPLAVALLGVPAAAAGVWRGGRRGARRKALGTICAALAVCALCFVPLHLSQLLRFLASCGLLPERPSPRLARAVQRVTSALASCSCCLSPLLYRLHCSSRAWRCPRGPRLRLRPARVFTICDRSFGDPAWACRAGQRRGGRVRGDGIN